MQNYNCWNKIIARDPQFVINLTAPQHDLQKRLLSRTGGRSDDNIATIQKRFKVRPILSSDASVLLLPFHFDGIFLTVLAAGVNRRHIVIAIAIADVIANSSVYRATVYKALNV